MTREEMTDALHDKMQEEQTQFEDELLQMPPEDLLKNAYSYWMREDILLAVDNHDLSNGQVSALLKLDKPLAAVYQEFMDTDHDILEPMRDSLESLADKELCAAEREVKPPSIREQLRAGGTHAAPDRTGKPPVQER